MKRSKASESISPSSVNPQAVAFDLGRTIGRQEGIATGHQQSIRELRAQRTVDDKALLNDLVVVAKLVESIHERMVRRTLETGQLQNETFCLINRSQDLSFKYISKNCLMGMHLRDYLTGLKHCGKEVRS